MSILGTPDASLGTVGFLSKSIRRVNAGQHTLSRIAGVLGPIDDLTTIAQAGAISANVIPDKPRPTCIYVKHVAFPPCAPGSGMDPDPMSPLKSYRSEGKDQVDASQRAFPSAVRVCANTS